MMRLQACQCHPMNCLYSTGASPVPPKRGGCDCLGHTFSQKSRGLTNTRQRTHRKPPLSAITPSQETATCSTSLTSPSRLCSGVGLCTCTQRLYAHWQRLTSIVSSLLGRMSWVLTLRHRTLHALRVNSVSRKEGDRIRCQRTLEPDEDPETEVIGKRPQGASVARRRFRDDRGDPREENSKCAAYGEIGTLAWRWCFYDKYRTIFLFTELVRCQ